MSYDRMDEADYQGSKEHLSELNNTISDLLEALEKCVSKLSEYADADYQSKMNGYGVKSDSYGFIDPVIQPAIELIRKVKGE